MKKLLFTILTFTAVIYSCKKNSNSTPKQDDQLSVSQLQILEAAPLDTNTSFHDLIFADGSNVSNWDLNNDSGYVFNFSRKNSILSASDKKKLFICRMSKAGLHLINDSLCSCYPAQPNGLAYVYGSFLISAPHNYPGAMCQQLLYGLDCSGMMYQMANSSNLNIPHDNTSGYAQPNLWNIAFNNSADFQGLEMEDLSPKPLPSDFQAGDIIVEPGEHIGMVYSTGITLGILNSQGSPDYDCMQNSSVGRGPVARADIPKWVSQLFPKNDYHVLRVGLPQVTIGTQVWTSKNLNVTKYRNGDLIPQVTDQAQWAKLTTGAWCYYNNDPANGAIYGKLYNWFAVNDPRGLAPAGWHIPTDAEWKTLVNYLGGETLSYGKMKEPGLAHWISPNIGATNSSGFSGLPGGSRFDNGYFHQIGEIGTWWSSTHGISNGAWCWGIWNLLNYIDRGNSNEQRGQSIRCIKD
jgi:uncharacterized protein (TIGR02145 family)